MSSCLAFFCEDWPAPLEYEGDFDATPIGNLWSLKRLSTDAHHSLIVLSFTEASRAIAPGRLSSLGYEVIKMNAGSDKIISISHLSHQYLQAHF